MREYETVYVLKADLPQDQLSDLKNKFNQTIVTASGKLLAESDWGKRRLAYTVEKQQHGHYIYLRYAGPGELVSRLERLLKLEDTVLKFLTVKLDESQAGEGNSSSAPEAPEEVLYERPSSSFRRPYRSYDDRSRRSHYRDDASGEGDFYDGDQDQGGGGRHEVDEAQE